MCDMVADTRKFVRDKSEINTATFHSQTGQPDYCNVWRHQNVLKLTIVYVVTNEANFARFQGMYKTGCGSREGCGLRRVQTPCRQADVHPEQLPATTAGG